MPKPALSKLITTALLGSSLSLVLTGCQPADESDAQAHSESESSAITHEHDEEAHAEHEEHADKMHAAEDEHADHDHSGHDHAGHEGHEHANNRIVFDCQPEKQLGVFYHEDETPSTAHILIDGIEYDFVQDSNLGEKTYISDFGLQDDHGLVWTVDQQAASLYSVPTAMAKVDTIASLNDLEQFDKLYSCQQQS
ncbi:hypothetical protein [Psychrobacter sp. FDAARGOS_221]|uniref:hypothetical protein n=1 Tax=Psychrobacter sp. FDAARGOS_221 TaxID=1975705 RepID=UPI000BB583DC|nr:hypothetical protein [Psychrobacter sp. FDAARGOS_221]PNK61254.1 hypothetical protein A6J60_010495 [Psychrobacter sp. FDAARGOS_221]